MIKCNHDCIPCCDFCIYAIRDVEVENGMKIDYGPKGCSKHLDEEHQEIAYLDGSCDDFHCFRAGKEDVNE